MSLRNLRAVRRDPVRFFAEASAEGGVVHRQVGPTTLTVLADAEAVHTLFAAHHTRLSKDTRGARILKYVMGESLISAKGGEVWKRHRRALNPAFRRARVSELAPMVQQVAHRHTEALPTTRFDLLAHFSRIAVEITGRSLFEDDIERHQDAIAEGIRSLTETYGALNRSAAPLPERMPTSLGRRYRGARRLLRAVATDIVSRRKGVVPTLEHPVDEVVSLLLAGSETMAVAATWASLQVDWTRMTEPEWRRLSLLESLRLRPPAWVMVRRTTAPCADLPEGRLVFVPIQALQRSGRHFDAPLSFRPERWITTPRPAAFFAFGDGPRRCVGENLAMHAMDAMITAMADRGTLSASTDMNSVSSGLSTRPLAPVWAVVRDRMVG